MSNRGWGTEDELQYIDLLPSYLECTREKALRNYLRGAAARADWGRTNAVVAIEYARTALQREMNK